MFSSQTPTLYLVVLQTSDSVVPSQCCRYTEYPARSPRQAPVASSSVAGGSLSHWNPPFPGFAWRDDLVKATPRTLRHQASNKSAPIGYSHRFGVRMDVKIMRYWSVPCMRPA